MNSELLARLMAATPEERSWILTESVLESLSPELRRAVWAVAVPHWFDGEILAALCPELAEQAEELYTELQALSFVERFGERGHNVHEATRKMLLDKLWQDRPEEFRSVSKLAADYFEKDETNRAEWLYHKAVVEPIGDDLINVMQPLDHNFMRSESEVILKALDEQISANRVDTCVAAQTAYRYGKVHWRFYESNSALGQYQIAIELYREVSDRLGEANSLYSIGNVLQFKNRRDEALENYQQAIGLYREVGARLGEANSLKSIGNLQEDTKKKLQFLQDAHQIYIDIGDRYNEANCNLNLQSIYQQQGRFKLARQFRHQAYRIWQDLQLPVAELPLPDFTKRMITSMDDGEWVETMIQSDNQMAWLIDSIGYLIFLVRRIFSPLTQLQKRFKIPPRYFWFCIGLAIVLLLWKLKN